MGHAHHTLFRRGAQREFPINFQITNGDSSTLREGVRIKIEIKVKKKCKRGTQRFLQRFRPTREE